MEKETENVVPVEDAVKAVGDEKPGIYIRDVDKKFDQKRFVRHLEELGIKSTYRVKKQFKWPYAMVQFNSLQEATDALEKIKAHPTWKATFDNKRKRDRDEEDGDQNKESKLNPSDDKPEKQPPRSVEEAVAPLAHLPYDQQLEVKQKDVVRVMTKMTREIMKVLPPTYKKMLNRGRVCCKVERSIVSSPVTYGYRNKCEFTAGFDENKQKACGFLKGLFSEGYETVGDPANVPFVSPQALAICRSFSAFLQTSTFDCWNKSKHQGFWRLLLVRQGEGTGGWSEAEKDMQHEVNEGNPQVLAMVQINPDGVDPKDLEAELARLDAHFQSDVTSGKIVLQSLLYQPFAGIHNSAPTDGSSVPVLIRGPPSITETILNVKFRVSPLAFFQVNSKATERLYALAGDWADVDQNTVLLDVCCGTGTIGLTLASRVKKVIGIEMVPSAIEDAKFNAAQNNITNVQYVCGKAEHVMPNIVRDYLDPSDKVVAIVDPPRSGLHQDVIRALRSCAGLATLVYISCNPQAFVTNSVALGRPASKKYTGVPFLPQRAQAIDLFPHTSHCELVVLMHRQPYEEWFPIRKRLDAAANGGDGKVDDDDDELVCADDAEPEGGVEAGGDAGGEGEAEPTDTAADI
eukprot:TRINITY_DN258_c0_g1::TRINITY_DN258_c0_g1_i1::g.1622::m.1622 TRINITY_DN258_c0_g1::TRINITY_DN258_c0_g1_i1::g.1622  ORF type:complete len:644 (+),score=106.65,sp/Q8IZ69/TRM2A_HUMAN/31.87/4e-84,tRNA_U5-meth_tr/PF05958.6/9.6e-20,Methyltransf_31/PF13847.1/1.1e-14,Methyltransf_26/PF13659.1/4.4e-09,Methyltransf_18/PF12847.2/1.6e-07,Methyltransf_4/PF02390.12/3.3e+03,Methyltransf_4/PF02390.12/3.3e-07,MTS/PF05175.9/2.5e-06,Methyltransf_25/PF13649.1/3.3e-05,Ubie_methyltran/PF01209.13/0.00019,PCMT/PF01135.14